MTRNIGDREAPRPRHASDGAQAVAAGLAVAVTAWLARRPKPSMLEVSVFRLVNHLPAALGASLLGVMQLGALAAVPVLGGIALLRHRVDVGRLLLLSGGGAWLAAKVLQRLVDQEPPDLLLSSVFLHGSVQPGPAFPTSHVAVAAGMATIIGPYLSRPNRRLAWLGVAAIGVARVYVGAHLPIDVLGGAAVGWGVGSIAHLVFGAPRGLPQPALVASALAAIGIEASEVISLPRREPGVAIFRIEHDHGVRLFAKALGRNQHEAGWFHRAWRLLAFREVEDLRPLGTPERRAEHEAYLLLLAAGAGLPVPLVRTTQSIREGEVLLVRSWVEGTALAALAADELTDDVLVRMWRATSSLHEADMSFGTPSLDDFVRGSDGEVWVVDLREAQLHPDHGQQGRDVAELLATCCLRVGPSRSAATAAATLTLAELADGLAALQPLTLSSRTRRAIAARRGLLDELRRLVASHLGVPLEPIRPPVRVAARNLVPLAMLFVAVNALLPRVAQAGATASALRAGSWPWLGVAVAASALTYLMAAIALRGAAGRPLAFGRTFAVQLAAAATNRVTPAGLGAMGTNVRYLEAAGESRPRAITAVALCSLTGFVVHTGALLAVVPLLGTQRAHFRLGADLPDYWRLLVAVSVVLGVVGAIGWGAWLRRRIVDAVQMLRDSVVVLTRRPAAAVALLGGSVGVTVCHALGLAAACRAFSVGLPVTAVVAVYLASSAVAAAAPTPGGLGALEAALVAGLTAGGAPVGPAVATVLAYRMVTYWLPIVPGAVAFHVLRRSGTI